MLKTLLLCCCVACCVGSFLSAQAQAPGGHPPGPPQGGHPPGPPPNGGPPSNGGSGGNGNGGGAGNSGGRSTGGNVTSPGGIKLGPPGRWWDDKTYAQAVGLRRDQQKKMDSIVDANRSAIVSTYEAFQKQQSALNAISKDPNADKAKLFAVIDAVNEAHAALQKANTQMLLQIRQQLDPEQVSKLEKLP